MEALPGAEGHADRRGLQAANRGITAGIRTIPCEDTIDRHDDPDAAFVAVRDVRELWRDGMIPGAFNSTLRAAPSRSR
jgi:hypothetical protein